MFLCPSPLDIRHRAYKHGSIKKNTHPDIAPTTHCARFFWCRSRRYRLQTPDVPIRNLDTHKRIYAPSSLLLVFSRGEKKKGHHWVLLQMDEQTRLVISPLGGHGGVVRLPPRPRPDGACWAVVDPSEHMSGCCCSIVVARG